MAMSGLGTTAWKTRQNPDLVKFMEDNYSPGFSYEDFAPMFMQGRAVRSRAVG